jgi:hypothetical protein
MTSENSSEIRIILIDAITVRNPRVRNNMPAGQQNDRVSLNLRFRSC